jgi:Smg protein
MSPNCPAADTSASLEASKIPFMFDILVYVFENYLPEACPEPGALARKLSAVGFEEDDISEALQWLAGLEQAHDEAGFHRLPEAGTHRLYDDEEMVRLSAQCRGFLCFLEQAEAIDATIRELIVERAMAVDGDENGTLSLAKFKVIVLMVMWRRQLSLDNLVFEDLLAEDEDDARPLMH